MVEPELDYLDGLFHVVVLAPKDATLPTDEPMPQALADQGWVRARPLSHGDPTSWRETLKLTRGLERGVTPGAAVAFGARLIGRVTRVGPWGSDASLLGDPGLTVVAVARFEGSYVALAGAAELPAFAASSASRAASASAVSSALRDV